jgi:hypothetical protein
MRLVRTLQFAVGGFSSIHAGGGTDRPRRR